MRKIELDDFKKEVDLVYRRRLIFVTILFIVLIALGTKLYHQFENWSYFDSLYFTITTLTTVGYGDLTPKTYLGRSFTMFYMIFGISIALYTLSFISSHFIERREVYWMNKLTKGRNIILRFPQDIIKLFQTKKFKNNKN